MQNIHYPIDMTFKITTLSNDFIAKDSTGATIAYTKQKLFKLKEKVTVFADEQQQQELFFINADKWLDFNTSYKFSNTQSNNLGRIARKGWKSLWKTEYEIYDENDHKDLIIREENVWIKILDGFFVGIPIIGMFSGYIFNPKYNITRTDGTLIAQIRKEQSFFGRRFKLLKITEFEEGQEERILLGTMMMTLLERRKG
jgi:uncharacterized protein YxjI